MAKKEELLRMAEHIRDLWTPDTWQASRAKCRICNHKEVCVYMTGTDDSAMECANCGNMTMETT